MADIGTRYPGSTGTLSADHEDPKLWTADGRARPSQPPTRDTSTRQVSAPTLQEPTESPLHSSEASARSPTRIVEIGGERVTVDRDIEVRASASGPAYADVRLWNLSPSTWANISHNHRVDIRLGWDNASTERIFRGRIATKRRRSRGGDRGYLIRATAEGTDTLKEPFSATYNDMPPHRMVSMLADDVGLDTGYISTLSSRSSGFWSVSKHKELRHWLDRLAERAARETDRPWVWYLDRGKLYFHPTTEQVTEPVLFSSEKSLIRATPTGQPRESGMHAYELVSHCEPLTRRGLTVEVEGVNVMPTDQRWRVRSYVFDSSTTEGRHHTYATVEPLVDRDELYEDTA